MNELIKITEENGRRAVSARELHQFLGSKQQFADWIKSRIEKYGFAENQDYEVFHNLMNNPDGGRPTTEYALSVDMAKELSMVENNERGRQARKYFIECEKRAKEVAAPSYLIEDSIARAQRWIEEQKETRKLAEQIEAQQKRIEETNKEVLALTATVSEMQPKVSYVDTILACKETAAITQIAQDYGKTPQALNALLRDLGIQHKVGKQWVLYADYLPHGYVQSETISFAYSDGRPGSRMFTKWTQKGRLFLYEELKRNGVLPLIEQ